MPEVDVIIVNYKTAALSLAAAHSALGEPETGLVWIVDNASGAEDLATLQSAAKDPRIRLIMSPDNVGFGRANNLAAERSQAAYLMLLNSDAELLPGALCLLLRTLHDDPEVGIVAPAVYLSDRATLQPDSQGIFPTAPNLLLQRTKRPVRSIEPDWLSGVAMLMRREEFLSLGGFSPEFFMYYEDVDLCYRYARAGFRMRRQLAAGVVHLGGRSSRGRTRQKESYYAAQDVFLRRIGTLLPLRLLVKMVRAMYQSTLRP